MSNITTKKDLIRIIAGKSDLNQAQVKEVLDSFQEEVTSEVARGSQVLLKGWCSFTPKQRKASTGRNPQTGESIQIPAKRVVKIKPGVEFQRAVS